MTMEPSGNGITWLVIIAMTIVSLLIDNCSPAMVDKGVDRVHDRFTIDDQDTWVCLLSCLADHRAGISSHFPAVISRKPATNDPNHQNPPSCCDSVERANAMAVPMIAWLQGTVFRLRHGRHGTVLGQTPQPIGLVYTNQQQPTGSNALSTIFDQYLSLFTITISHIQPLFTIVKHYM